MPNYGSDTSLAFVHAHPTCNEIEITSNIWNEKGSTEPQKYTLERGERTNTHDRIFSYDDVINENVKFRCANPSWPERTLEITGWLKIFIINMLPYLEIEANSTMPDHFLAKKRR